MLSGWINTLEEKLLSLMLVVMTLLTFVEVVLRFGFNTGVDWSQEVTLYLCAWFVLLGASYGVKTSLHIGIDSFVLLFPSKIRRAIGILAALLCMIYSVILMIGAWGYLAKLKLIGIEMDDLPVPRWLGESVILIAFLLLFIRFAQVLLKIIKGERELLIEQSRNQVP